VPVANPPKVVEPKEEKSAEASDEDAEDNPGIMKTVKKITGGVSLFSMAMGAAGVIGAIVVPKIVKWNTGWKDLAATAAIGAVGGFLIGKFLSKPAAVAFVISAGGVFLLKAVRWVYSGFKSTAIGAQEELFADDDVIDEDYLSDEIYDVGLFGEMDTSTDRVIPTSGIDNLY
jgi:hypothetical protein